MNRPLLVMVALAGGVALLGAGVALGSSSATMPTLRGTVGPKRTISLVNAGGRRVKQLPGGTYRFVIRDRSTHENFHLIGPAINRFEGSTGVAFRGTVTWTFTLSSGTYRYRSDAHPKSVHGTFRVTNAPTP